MTRTVGRLLPYRSDGQTELFNWLRENPHRLLSWSRQISSCLTVADKKKLQVADLSEIHQELILARGSDK